MIINIYLFFTTTSGCGEYFHLIPFVGLRIEGEAFNDHYFVTDFVETNKLCIS